MKERDRGWEAKETKEKETEAPGNEARRDNVRRVEPRRLVPELAWQRQYQHPCDYMAGTQW